MKQAIRRHPLLAAGFGLALVLFAFFALRLAMMVLVWPPDRSAPLEGWMTIGYVAAAHSLPREAVAEAIGLTPGAYPRQSLARIAQARGESLDALLSRLQDALDQRHDD